MENNKKKSNQTRYSRKQLEKKKKLKKEKLEKKRSQKKKRAGVYLLKEDRWDVQPTYKSARVSINGNGVTFPSSSCVHERVTAVLLPSLSRRTRGHPLSRRYHQRVLELYCYSKMGIPDPRQDPVLLREHQFRSTLERELVVPEETHSFVPVREQGLGLMNYDLVDPQRLTNEGALKRDTVKSAVGVLTSGTVVMIVVVVMVVIGYVVYRSIYRRAVYSGRELRTVDKAQHDEEAGLYGHHLGHGGPAGERVVLYTPRESSCLNTTSSSSYVCESSASLGGSCSSMQEMDLDLGLELNMDLRIVQRQT